VASAAAGDMRVARARPSFFQHRGLRRTMMLLPAVLLMALLLYAPLGWLLTQSFSNGESFGGQHSSVISNYENLYRDRTILRSYWTSLWFALVSAAIVAVIVYPIAYVLSNLRPRLAAVLFIIVLVPFWSSLTVSLFAFQLLLGRAGPVNRILEWAGVIQQPLNLLFTATSVIVGFVYVGLPLMVLPLYAAMRRIDQSIMDAASTLGAPPRRAFVDIFLPLSMPGVVAGSTLVFVTTVGYFIVPQLLGGEGQNTIGQYIIHEVQVQNDIPGAAAMTVGLIAMTVVFILLASRLVHFDRFWSRAGDE
jgi:ABC-type spermidine/putrescine transport system permease subunit I